MITKLQVSRHVYCPFSATIDVIELFHRTHGSLRMHSPLGLHIDLSCDANQIRDITDDTRVHEAMLLRWSSRAHLLLPVLHGLVTVRPNGLTTTLTMEATYVPPWGPIGVTFDRLLGRRLVTAAVEQFLEQIVAFIEVDHGLDVLLTSRPS